MHFGAFKVHIGRNLRQCQRWCSGEVKSLVLIWRTLKSLQQSVASTSQVLHTRNTYFNKRKKKKDACLWGVCLQFNCSTTLLSVSPLWSLSCISPPKLLVVHSCKSYRSFLALHSSVDQYLSRTMLWNTQLKSGNKAFWCLLVACVEFSRKVH